MREEKRPASDEIEELAPGVRRLQLPIDLPGLGHVNCYILEDRRGVAVVDPGLPGPKAWRALRAGLARADVDPRHVHTIIITHSHADHFGGAARLRNLSGAEVVTHESFSTMYDPVEDDTDAIDSVDDAAENTEVDDDSAGTAGRVLPGATPWGGQWFTPPRHRRLLFRVMQGRLMRRYFPTTEVSNRVSDGAAMTLAGHEFRAVHTPGHTFDHLCLHDEDGHMLISGDHILPTITPHISGMSRQTDPLREYFESLDKVADAYDAELTLPAHGDPFRGLRERVAAIKRHHNERLDILREAGGELGWAEVSDYMRRLFKQRSWGPMAESETYAHLEHLRIMGEVNSRRNAARMLEFGFV